MRDGYFGPDSVTWRVTRERAMLLGGPRALLMQLAHPLVAAGVADHSAFPRQAVRRLRRTLELTLTIVFGTREEAGRAAASVNAVHARVHGTLGETVGRHAAGTPYDARDPELLLWVHATLLDTSLAVYPRFVAPLSPAEQDALWQESKIAARLLGVPDSVLPGTVGDFRAYVDGMLASDAVAVGRAQREMAGHVLRPWPVVPRAAAAITISLLPETLRRAYGLSGSGVASRLASRAPWLVHGLLDVAPRSVRVQRLARRAEASPLSSV